MTYCIYIILYLHVPDPVFLFRKIFTTLIPQSLFEFETPQTCDYILKVDNLTRQYLVFDDEIVKSQLSARISVWVGSFITRIYRIPDDHS